MTQLICSKNERQRSVNNFGPSVMENPRVFRRHCAIIRLSAAFLGEDGCDDTATMSSQ